MDGVINTKTSTNQVELAQLTFSHLPFLSPHFCLSLSLSLAAPVCHSGHPDMDIENGAKMARKMADTSDRRSNGTRPARSPWSRAASTTRALPWAPT